MAEPRYTLEEGLARLRAWCDLQERCPSEVRRKLQVWSYDADIINSWIFQMQDEGYVDELRFAQAFVSGKFRLKRWGRRKIQSELKFREIQPEIITRVLAEIDDDEYDKSLDLVLERKMRDTPLIDRSSKGQVARYAISKGYEPELVWEAIARKSEG